MVARPAVVPRARTEASTEAAAETRPAGADLPLGEPTAPGKVEKSVAAPAPEPAGHENSSIDLDDAIEFTLSVTSPDFQVEAAIDPVDAEAEDAAVLFANAQDDSVRAVLENAVRIHHSGAGERLWLMLFDFYTLTGQKAAFEALGIDYAHAFEKSPPGWRDRSRTQPNARDAVAAGRLLFKGDLTGDNTAAFDAIRHALEKNRKLSLDLSLVGRLDAAGCGRLLSQLQHARKSGRELALLGRETLAALLEKRVECGRAEDAECWLLLLELCQLRGEHQAFEDVAINYAVTFEVSPPSWEAHRVAAPEPALAAAGGSAGQKGGNGANGANEIAADAYVLRGDVKASRFGDLPAYAGVHDPLLIDCSGLTRIDFISAGALLNVLSSLRRGGKQIVFRHPNHLVAELFRVVGLKTVASIVFAKN
jgi:anti-anti-sigma regulatory factor